MTSRASRGVTLLEVMTTMAVMLLGIAAAMTVVSETTRSNRRTLTANQAQLIAEQTLEGYLTQGCQGSAVCDSISDTSFQVWQTSEGMLRREAPPAGVEAREYRVDVDVDNSQLIGTVEGAAMGEPAINRPLALGNAGNLVNVRVSVSWEEPQVREGRQVVVLQTRLAP
jgi:prepilin-type N-terminal cleavage/methylation domain-containing protein